jgi:integrating conjugative element protein (TIGR03759 family)
MKAKITEMKVNMKTKITKMKTEIKTEINPITFLISLLLISINVNANNTINNNANYTANNTANSTANNIATNTATNTFIKTKTTTTKTILTNFEKQQQAKITLKMNHLNLSKEELIRSDHLQAMTLEMDSNNTLSSLEILGIFATTAEQKRNYARKFVISIRNYTTKVLAFQKYVNQAHKDMYGSGSMFDYTLNSKASPTTQTRTAKTINLNDCDERCEHEIKTLVRLPLMFPVDLYFKEASNTDIQQWALRMNLSRDAVEQGLITLNHAY